MQTGAPIYLDNHATTPMDPRVRDAILHTMTQHFGNPHSTTHSYGWQAEAVIDIAREQVAGLLGCGPRQVIFTSGATEANNQAIKGVAMGLLGGELLDRKGARRAILYPATEHSCVVAASKDSARFGAASKSLPVCADGRLDMDQLADALGDDVLLLSVMLVNNEIGTVQDIATIGTLARAQGVLLHVDAAQGSGRVDFAQVTPHVDMLSISGHKMYGPKGIGALYVRDGMTPRLVPLLSGGGQEFGLRSGTQVPMLAAGIGMAATLAQQEMASDEARIAALADRMMAGLDGLGIVRNGAEGQRVAGNLSLTFSGVDGPRLLTLLPGLAMSAGSACASGRDKPSHVLTAIGLDKAAAASTLRFGLGRFTTEAEIDSAVEQISEALARYQRERGLA